MKKQSNLKVGELVYLKDVGYPYHDSADPGGSWEGASCIVSGVNAGFNDEYVKVKPIFPINGMDEAFFHPHVIIRENRVWLRRHLKLILSYRKELKKTSEKIQKMVEDF